MLGVERKAEIISIIKESKKVLVSDLAKHFQVSDETIRKDLRELEKSDILIRSHGGAVLKEGNMPPSFIERETINFESKSIIAKLCQAYITSGMTVMVDTATTSKIAIQHISPKSAIKIITNSFSLISECQVNTNLKFLATGGEVKSRYRALVGRDCIKTISGYYADLAILGCTSLNPQLGIMESNTEEADIKIAMAKHAARTIIVADHTKFDKTSPICSLSLKEIDVLVTDIKPSQDWLDACTKANVEVAYKL